jgi:hypothetical protein
VRHPHKRLTIHRYRILLSDAMCFDNGPIYLPVSKESSDWGHLSAYPPTGLLSIVLNRASTSSHRPGLAKATFTILEHIHAAISLLTTQASTDELMRLGPIPDCPSEFPSSMSKLIHESCRLASMIFWSVVNKATSNKAISSASATATELDALQGLLRNLKLALAKTDQMSWLETAPEACQWVCFTGGAASFHVDQRSWFIIFQASVEAALDSEDVFTLKNGLSYFRWLRKLYLDNYSRIDKLD